MIDVVGVSFDNSGRVYYFSPAGFILLKDEQVIVETEKGLQIGKVTIPNSKIKKDNLNLPLKTVIRVADKEDCIIKNKIEIENIKALDESKKLVKKYNLSMNIIDANFTFDRKQLLFHFTADARVDFRDLAKDLASLYKTRIELRQIGVRDKARLIGGTGPCGRLLCCTSFLYDFDSVSINMAKNQNIALNPNKINGACGRLLCCLTYENDDYTYARKELPEIGQIVKISEGTGKVVGLDIIRKTYKVDIPNVGVIVVETK